MGTGGGLVVIDFSESGNSSHFRRDGWSGQEPDRVWAIGPRSVLVVPIQSSGQPIVLEAELGPARPTPLITGQIVRVKINGIAIGGLRIEARTMIRTEIDPTLVGQNGVVTIEFSCPGFLRPSLLCESNDDRPLSCWFSFARIYTIGMFKPGPWFPTSHPDIPIASLSPSPSEASKAVPLTVLANYTFGPHGTAKPYLGDGWDVGKNNVSIVRSAAQFTFPAPRASGCHAVRVNASPVLIPGEDPKPYMTILLDRIVVGQIRVAESAMWVLPLPRELTDARDVLRFDLVPSEPGENEAPDVDAASRCSGIAVSGISIIRLPSTFAAADCLRAEQSVTPRPMAISGEFLNVEPVALPAAVRAALGMDTHTLARGFESLGTDRAFAVVQRRLGLEVLNLFRFCEGTVADLTRALTDDLQAVANPDRIIIRPSDGGPSRQSFAVPSYNLRWRMFDHENGVDGDGSRRANAVTLSYLRRKFYEGLRAGRKIYVLKPGSAVSAEQAVALLLELNRGGEAILLCVEEAPDGRMPGEVELMIPGLMRGFIERATQDAEDDTIDLAQWVRVLANATLLKRASGARVVH